MSTENVLQVETIGDKINSNRIQIINIQINWKES